MVFSSSGHISIVSICVALLVGFFVSGPALLEASLVISLSMLALLQLFLVFPFMDTNPASLGSRAATRLEQSCQFASPQEAISAQPILESFQCLGKCFGDPGLPRGPQRRQGGKSS